MTSSQPTTASIDELLGGASADDLEDQPRRSDGSLAREVVKFAFFAACITAVGYLALALVKLTAPPWFIFAVACAIVAVYQAVRRVRPPLPARAAWRRHAVDPPPDGLRGAVKRWETRLEWCYADNGAYNRKVLPLLGEIVDERLRQRHGITRESDPARARKLVGEPLWTFLAAPGRRPPAPRELANLIAWMERI
jgi:hypothetical protein